MVPADALAAFIRGVVLPTLVRVVERSRSRRGAPQRDGRRLDLLRSEIDDRVEQRPKAIRVVAAVTQRPQRRGAVARRAGRLTLVCARREHNPTSGEKRQGDDGDTRGDERTPSHSAHDQDGSPAAGIARGFLAIVPPPDVLDAIDRSIAASRDAEPELRWVRRDAWHITLQFLGRVERADVLVDALVGAAARSRPFSMQLRGAGAFPSAKRGAVLWAGVGDGSAEVVALAGAVVDATAVLGFAAEAKPFHPHLTLARVRPPRRLIETVTAHEAASWGPTWTVDSFALMQSDTRPDGAVYTQRAQVLLSP